MIEKSWAWAKNFPPGVKHRTNEIHGEEEIKIVLRETFENQNANIEEVDRVGTFAVEEGAFGLVLFAGWL